jgi:predicted CoA-substrate-specific enzyme activase
MGSTEKGHVVGVDVGSVTTKAVLLNRDNILAHKVIPSGGEQKRIEKTVIDILSQKGLSLKDVASVGVTGCGSSGISGEHFSEITCLGRGTNAILPSVRVVIDLGGMATRVMRINRHGEVVDFQISEKCAAGSGWLLQIIARVLGVSIADLGRLSLESKQPVKFNSSCAVFAESETISRLAGGAKKQDIIAGIHDSMAVKVKGLVYRVGLEPHCALIGGGAKNIGLMKSIEQAIGQPVLVPEEPQIMAAFGAALLLSSTINEACARVAR